MNEERLAGVMHAPVSKDVTHIVKAQISLRKPAIRMKGYDRNSRFPHPAALRMKPGPLRNYWQFAGPAIPAAGGVRTYYALNISFCQLIDQYFWTCISSLRSGRQH